jgi:2-oxoglutarate ferredoxin oxidoreductase subunit beta
VFRDFERPVYGEAMHAQLQSAEERLGKGDLETLLHGGPTWTVG